MSARRVVQDEVLYLRAAGVDVGKRFVLACVRAPHPVRAGRWEVETERFETDAASMRALAQWLGERAVEVVALEATSDYWRAVYYPLQDAGLNPMLVNPAHLKGIRGRKSDPSDAAFLARAAASGMVMASLVPERAIRELRDLTRRRTEVKVQRGREVQRLEKELEDTGIKLSSVLTDLSGASSRRIIAALIDGQRDPDVLADLALGPARRKIPALARVLEGTFTAHHAFMCRHLLEEIDHLGTVLARLDERIAALLREREHDLERLATIPGIARNAAEVIIAETGGEITRFETAAHLASWIGVCPGINESAGITKSTRTRRGNPNLKRILGIAAMSAIGRKDTYLHAYYRRIAARRGGPRALVAVMRKLAIAIWHVLHDQTPYREPGPDHHTRTNPARAIARITRQANALGLTVRFDPIEA